MNILTRMVARIQLFLKILHLIVLSLVCPTVAKYAIVIAKWWNI